ncbi:chromosomal replication initiator protein DnaA [Mycoplasma phocoenae]|uniref:Chromosomal replication initiator protein DnaA n=1 Tax=Mycoplasma phocoenae TaxID=754517 RepID=A0A858U931_9MOLU|nr:chromosomal replication initiator protein DnaA [Mycoplasma phocoenae]QJG67218.1 chromosomal replication initiator protein DnaA [Mycoplasma phocoenae]
MKTSTTTKIQKTANLEVNNELLLKELEANASDPFIFDSLFSNIKIVEEQESKIFLLLSSEIRAIISDKYDDFIKRAIWTVYAGYREVVYITDINEMNKNTVKTQSSSVVSNINKKLTFETYARGEFNKFALNGADQIISQDEVFISPLFIFSSSGLGKTHLLHAIGNELLSKNKTCKYINPDFFTRDIVQQLQAKDHDKINEIVEYYGQYDCLMFDDVQLFGNREHTLNVLFNIINNHINASKQIIICADKRPEELGGFEQRFITRFQGGVTFEIHDPSVEDVSEIFKFKFKQKNINPNNFNNDAIQFLARNFNNSIREIDGTVNKIMLFKNSDQRFSYDVSYLKNIFKGGEKDKDSITPEKIVDIVAKYYKIDKKKLTGKNRSAPVVLARRICMWLIKDILGLTFKEIGNMFGGQAHSSVMVSVEYIDKNLKSNSSVSVALNKIKDQLKKII